MPRFIQLEGAIGEGWGVYRDDFEFEVDFPEMPRIDLPSDHPLVIDLSVAEIQRERWQARVNGIYEEIGKLIHQQEIERGNR